jgi:CRISPR-associated protein Csh2
MSDALSRRREFLFLYDIRMGNPNGDPDENRPRRLPDGTFYVTDVRLKRFVRDWLKTQGHSILVDRPEDAATNLTGRVRDFLRAKPDLVRQECEEYEKLINLPKPEARSRGKGRAKDKAQDSPADEGREETRPGDATAEAGGPDAVEDTEESPQKIRLGRIVVDIILKAFIDARLFGSALAFEKAWGVAPRPKTLTGAVQINMGEILHPAQEVDIAGTSIFASKEEKTQGTFTSYYGLRYGLIGFNGIANEHSAGLSRLTDEDYELFLRALWKSVGGAPTANTRSKMGQVPRLLVDIAYKQRSEFQFGCLLNYAKVLTDGRSPAAIASPDDYTLDLRRLVERLEHPNIERVRYAVHPDLRLEPGDLPQQWQRMDLDKMKDTAAGA